MRKTLLLVFIHGFKGNDDTFGTFPEHIRALLSHALPKLSVKAEVYPKYETRGRLKDCVARFRAWLEDKVIDLEVENNTPSPTVDPSVHVILVGHSMGGIVAAETLIALAAEKPIFMQDASSGSLGGGNTTGKSSDSVGREPVQVMFPHVQGLLAFDTPFLGLAPQMVAHGLEGGHKLASNAYDTYSDVASVFGWSGSKKEMPTAGLVKPNSGALPAPGADIADAAATPKWQSWGKMAMFAGAAGAIVAGSAAALYSQRDNISAGWSWATSHLLFVGDLAKAEFLRQRVESIERICNERHVKAANVYTNLGRGAREGYGLTEQLAGRDRTFCNLPATANGSNGAQASSTQFTWLKAVNDKAKDETSAHVSMFFPKDNPGFYALGESSKELVTAWMDQGWYNSATAGTDLQVFAEQVKPASVGKDWEGLDGTHDMVEEDIRMTDEIHDSSDGQGSDMLEDSVIVDTSLSASNTLVNSKLQKIPESVVQIH